MLDSTEHQLMLVPHSYQGSLIEQRSADGYINATAMCKAAGKEWANYRQNGTTKAFLEALTRSLGIPRDLIVQSIATGPNDNRGTWVHPQVAIHLAQWLSPEFAVKVTEWVYDWMLGRHPSDKIWQQFEDRVSLVNDNVPEGFWCVFREIADLFAAMITRGIDPGTKIILDLSVGTHWSNYWRENDLDLSFGLRMRFDHYYPKYFPQALSNPQSAYCYPEEALPAFRRWLRDFYIPERMPEYLRSQVRQKKIPAQLANNALAALAERRANRALPKSAA